MDNPSDNELGGGGINTWNKPLGPPLRYRNWIPGFGYAKLLAPPEWGLRWVENRLNLLKILPHYVSIDKTTYGRFGVLPTTNRPGPSGSSATELVGTTQRLGP
ncbi:putative rhomboid protease [Fusarium irregulare]|nr:putative rhomboid protease [Fusarium irregulare]